MNNKIILDLCGGTGAWSKPYANAGYKVFNLTLPLYDVRCVIVEDGLLQCIKENTLNVVSIKVKDIYGILAAPPCTMFSVARTNAKTPRDFNQGLEIVRACLNIIYDVSLDHKLAFWALENPRGYLRHFIGLPAYTCSPWEFGDPYKKRTDLWGNFKLPKKVPIQPDSQFNSKNGEDWHHNGIKRPKGMAMAEYRAITPAGFALAFYKANK